MHKNFNYQYINFEHLLHHITFTKNSTQKQVEIQSIIKFVTTPHTSSGIDGNQ